MCKFNNESVVLDCLEKINLQQISSRYPPACPEEGNKYSSNFKFKLSVLLVYLFALCMCTFFAKWWGQVGVISVKQSSGTHIADVTCA